MSLDQQKQKLDCPEAGCTSKISVSIADWAAGKTVKCPKGHTVKLEGKGARQVQQSMQNLERTLKNFGKR